MLTFDICYSEYFLLPVCTRYQPHLIKENLLVTCRRPNPINYPVIPIYSVTAFLLLRRFILIPTNGDSSKSNASLSKVIWTNATFLLLSSLFFNPLYYNSKFLASQSLTFNLACEKFKLPPPYVTHSCVS